MLAMITPRLIVILLVAVTLLGLYRGFETGRLYGKPSTPGVARGVMHDGSYVLDNEVYYPQDNRWAGYSYEPSAKAYYESHEF